MNPWDFNFADMWNNNVANNLGAGWEATGIPPMDPTAAPSIAPPQLPPQVASPAPPQLPGPALGIAAITNPQQAAEVAIQNGIPPTVVQNAAKPAGETPSLGASLEPKGADGSSPEDTTEVSSKNKDSTWDQRLLAAFKGVKPIAAPEPPRVGTPAAPRATGQIRGGNLMALLAALGQQQQGQNVPRVPTLPNVWGGR